MLPIDKGNPEKLWDVEKIGPIYLKFKNEKRKSEKGKVTFRRALKKSSEHLIWVKWSEPFDNTKCIWSAEEQGKSDTAIHREAQSLTTFHISNGGMNSLWSSKKTCENALAMMPKWLTKCSRKEKLGPWSRWARRKENFARRQILLLPNTFIASETVEGRIGTGDSRARGRITNEQISGNYLTVCRDKACRYMAKIISKKLLTVKQSRLRDHPTQVLQTLLKR